jgi:hypothetical protein
MKLVDALRLANRAAAGTVRGEQRGKERGAALLMALVVVAVLSALSIQFSYNLSANISMAGNLVASTQAYYNARSASRIALLAVNAKQNFPQMQQFLSLMGKSAASRLEIWQRACDFVNIFATGKAEFFGTTLLDFSQERAVGANSLNPGVAAFKCTVTAEDARVSLNHAAGEAPVADANGDPAAQAQNVLRDQQIKASAMFTRLGGMFEDTGLFDKQDDIIDLVLNIIDWTDADQSKGDIDPQGNYTASTGAEPDYGQYGYESKDAKMDTVGELQLVEGMTSELFCKVRDQLTVFGTDKINVNDADLAVLRGVLCQSIQDETARMQICMMPGPSGLPPMSDALVALDACRNLKKQVYSTPFTSMSRFVEFFTQFPDAMGTGVPLPITASIVNQQLGVKTKMVRIEAEGIYGDTKRKMVSVVDTSTGALLFYHYE